MHGMNTSNEHPARVSEASLIDGNSTASYQQLSDNSYLVNALFVEHIDNYCVRPRINITVITVTW